MSVNGEERDHRRGELLTTSGETKVAVDTCRPRTGVASCLHISQTGTQLIIKRIPVSKSGFARASLSAWVNFRPYDTCRGVKPSPQSTKCRSDEPTRLPSTAFAGRPGAGCGNWPNSSAAARFAPQDRVGEHLELTMIDQRKRDLTSLAIDHRSA